MTKRTWMMFAFVGCLAVTAEPASAQISITIGLPPAVIATQTPVYYEGRPAYWYGNRWYYRDAQRHWGYYRNEPPYLRDHRMHHPPPVRYYDHHPRR